jgi:hypothetical protein
MSVSIRYRFVKLSDEMREAVIAAVHESGQFVEKPTGDEQQSVEFRADRFKVTDGVMKAVNPPGRSSRWLTPLLKRRKHHLPPIRGDGAMASTQAAITESD